MPKYLFTIDKKFINELGNKIKLCNRIILFLDYDGTLVPIKKTPQLAVLPQSTLMILKHLTKNKRLKLVIVSGRSHSDLKRLIRISKITIISNHGFEISGNNIKWINPGIKKILPSLKMITKTLKKEFKNIEGTIIENKKLTITVHFRNVKPRSIFRIKKIVDAIVQEHSGELISTLGKKIIEVRPNIDWNKGHAVVKILTHFQKKKTNDVAIYIGDDKTDEDAFFYLNQNAITIRVGKSKNTLAKYHVKNTREVNMLLNEIIFQKKV